MSAITLEQAKAKLQIWMDAEEALATAQSYNIDTGGSRRTLTRADLVEVGKRINYWSGMVERLARGSSGPRVRYVLPRD